MKSESSEEVGNRKFDSRDRWHLDTAQDTHKTLPGFFQLFCMRSSKRSKDIAA